MTDYTDRNDKRNMIMNMVDVTERQRAEEALKESEQLFRTLVEGAPDAIIVQTNDRFAYLNRTAVDLIGLESEDQLLGRLIWDRIHPSSRDSIFRQMKQLGLPQEKKHSS